MIVCFASPLARTHSEWLLAYLVEGTGAAPRGDGARAGASRPAPIHAERRALAILKSVARPKMADPTMRPARRPRRRDADPDVASLAPVHSVAPARPSAPPSEHPAASPGDAAASRSGRRSADDVGAAAASNGGAGAGIGALGDGAGDGDDPNALAHADYGINPPPAYPAIARRRAQQGTVTVKVLVGADGSVERAEVVDSSGFDALDDAALETVRSRWRFVPARHGGLAVESWVLVPIRFALVQADAVR